MALTPKDAAGNQSGATGTQAPAQAQDHVPGTGKGGLGSVSLGLMSGTMSSDVGQLAIKMNKLVADTQEPAAAKAFQRSKFTELAFDTIVVQYEGAKNVYYFTYMFGASGYAPITVSSYMEQLVQNNRPPFLTTDALDTKMMEIVEPYIAIEGKPVINMDGLFLPADLQIDDDVVGAITAIGFNACKVQAILDEGKETDATMSDLITSNNRSFLSLGLNSLTANHIDRIGNPRKVSWGVTLSATKNQDFASPNTLGGTHAVVSAKGLVNYLPEEMPVAVQGAAVQHITRFRPEVVINTLETPIPSLGYGLLGIAASMIVAKDDNWLAPALANLADKDIGVFNSWANINNVEKPGAMKLAANSVKEQERITAIKQIVANTPIVAIDIEAFTENSHVLSTFAAAAVRNSEDAIAAIHNTAKTLSDGIYNYNGPIFDGMPLNLPVGYWSDSHGVQRTIDDIDTVYIAKHGATITNLISDYVRTEMGMTPDSFNERLDQIGRLKIDAVVTGRKLRIKFHTAFIQAFLGALVQSGFKPRFDSQHLIQSTTGFAFTAGAFQNSQLENIPGFAPYAGNQSQWAPNANFGQTAFYRG